MNKLIETKDTGVMTSVQDARPETPALFITISPWEKAKIVCTSGKKELKYTYGKLPQKIQYDFCIKYFKNVYIQYMPDANYIGVVEHNKSGNVHLHILLWESDTKTDYDLDMIRRHVNTHPMTVQYGCLKAILRFNNIVFADDVDAQFQYMSKDLEKSLKYYPIIISSDLYDVIPEDSDLDTASQTPDPDTDSEIEI